MAYVGIPSAGEAEAEGSTSLRPAWVRETLSQKAKTKEQNRTGQVSEASQRWLRPTSAVDMASWVCSPQSVSFLLC